MMDHGEVVELIKSYSMLSRNYYKLHSKYENTVGVPLGVSEFEYTSNHYRILMRMKKLKTKMDSIDNAVDRACLPMKERIIVDNMMDGYSARKIAKMFGVSHQFVNGRFRKAVEKIVKVS